MLLSLKNTVGYLHIQKTGGTSFGRFLIDNYGFENNSELPHCHYTLKEVVDYIYSQGLRPSDFTIYVTLRNPLEMLVSLYEYIRASSDKYEVYDLAAYRELYIKKLSFSEFAEFTLKAKDSFLTYDEILWLPESYEIPKVVFLNTENLKAELAKEFPDAKVPLKWMNSVAHDDWHYYYQHPLFSPLIDKLKIRHRWYYEKMKLPVWYSGCAPVL